MKRAIGIVIIALSAACGRPEPTTTYARLTSGSRVTPVKRMNGFVQNIEKLTTENRDFRHVLYTAKGSQLVVMAIPPGEHIGMEVHDVDQFFRVEAGSGEVVIDGARTSIADGTAIVIPAGANHDIINTGVTPLQLYTLYSPPHHRDGVVHHTRNDAEKDSEEFDGKTTE